jgi:predicted nucleic acid-binding protein
MNSFFDSNVLLYLVEEGPNTLPAQALLQNGGKISVQVLNEFVSVCRRKYKLEFEDIADFLLPIKETLEVVDLNLATHERAMEIAVSTNFEIFDCNIIAAAELSGCDVLYTEDMNNGQRIGRVAIVNPFAAA